jgi:hypothetical protein
MIATAPIARPAMAPLDIPLDEELLVGTGEGCEAVVVAVLVEEVLVVLVVLLEVAFDCTRASGMSASSRFGFLARRWCPAGSRLVSRFRRDGDSGLRLGRSSQMGGRRSIVLIR